MGINRRVIENTSVLVLSQIVAQLANFGFVIVFARVYGASLLGEYSFALSLGALLAAMSSMGGRHLTLKQASEDITRWKSLVGIFIPVQIGLSAIALLVVFAGTHIAEIPNERRFIIFVVCSSQLIVSWSVLVATGFSAQEKMSVNGVAEALRCIAVFTLGTLAIWSGLPATLAVVPLPIIAGLVTLTLLIAANRNFGPIYWRVAFSELAAALKLALPFLGIALASILFLRLGVLMLRAISGSQAVGVFSAAERLVAAVIILQTMFTNALFPRLVKLQQIDASKFQKLAQQGQRLIVLIALPVATLLALLAEDLVLLLYGRGYSGTVGVLQIVAWIMILRGLSGISSAVAIARGRQTDVVVSKLAGVIALIVSGALLIPGQAEIGLALALVCAELGVLSTLAWRMKAVDLLSSIKEPIARTLLACGSAAAIGSLLQSHDLWIRFTGIGIAGTLALWIGGAVRWRDVQYFAGLLRTQRHDPL